MPLCHTPFHRIFRRYGNKLLLPTSSLVQPQRSDLRPYKSAKTTQRDDHVTHPPTGVGVGGARGGQGGGWVGGWCQGREVHELHNKVNADRRRAAQESSLSGDYLSAGSERRGRVM